MARRPRSFLLLLVLIGWARPAGAQDPAAIPPERIEAVERLVERSWSRLGLPGVAVSVATGDSVLLATAYGAGTVTGEPLTAHTPIHIGSVTKTFTAALAARLTEEGALDLDAPVETYLPGFEMNEPWEPGTLTLRHLLQHRSGLRQWDGHDRRAQEEGAFDHLSPAGPPGEEARYSSLNFMILGRVLEAASGQAYEQLLQEALFRPLGMTEAFVAGSREPPEHRALGHQSYFGLQRPMLEPPPRRYLVPAGFAGASAYDMGRYGGMLVGGGAFAGTRILNRETVASLLGPLDSSGRALSWGRQHVNGTLVLGHSGNARTTSARVRLLPEEGYAITVLATTNSGPFFGATDDLLDGIHDVLAGEPEPRLWPRERIFKGAILLGTALSVVGMLRRAHRWGDAGHPVRLERSAGTLGRLAFDVGGGAFLLFGVPRLVGVPLSTMLEYLPDLGIALGVSAGAGIIGGLLHAFTRSAPEPSESLP